MPRIRFTAPLGSWRLATSGSRRNDRMAAMEVMGLLMARPPLDSAAATPAGSPGFRRDYTVAPNHRRSTGATAAASTACVCPATSSYRAPGTAPASEVYTGDGEDPP